MLIIKIGFEASPPTADLPQNRFWVFIIRIAGMKYKGAQRAPLYFILLFFVLATCGGYLLRINAFKGGGQPNPNY
jgi:hypothetical protein